MKNASLVSVAAGILVVSSLLMLPDPARAQAKTAVVSSPKTAKDTKAVMTLEVRVDWVDIPDTDVSTTNVGPGPDQNGRLMAALIQNGAIDTKGPRLKTLADTFGSIHVRTDIPTTVMIDGKPQKTALHLDDFTEVTAQIIPEDSIMVTGGVQRQKLVPGSGPASASTDFLPFNITVRNGEAYLLNGPSVIGFGATSQKHYVFLTVTTIHDKTASRQ